MVIKMHKVQMQKSVYFWNCLPWSWFQSLLFTSQSCKAFTRRRSAYISVDRIIIRSSYLFFKSFSAGPWRLKGDIDDLFDHILDWRSSSSSYFFLILCYFESFSKERSGEAIFILSYRQVPVKIWFILCMCFFRTAMSRSWTFSRDIRMDMEAGKATHVEYLLLIFWHSFCIPNYSLF